MSCAMTCYNIFYSVPNCSMLLFSLTMLSFNSLCCVVFRCIVWCGVLCCVVLCCIVLCVVLWCVVLCCVFCVVLCLTIKMKESLMNVKIDSSISKNFQDPYANSSPLICPSSFDISFFRLLVPFLSLSPIIKLYSLLSF